MLCSRNQTGHAFQPSASSRNFSTPPKFVSDLSTPPILSTPSIHIAITASSNGIFLHRLPLPARSQQIFLPDATYYLSTTAISHGLAFVHFCSSSSHIFPPFLDDKAFADNTRLSPTQRITHLRLRFCTDPPSTNSAPLLSTSSHLPSTTKLSSTTPSTSTSLLPHFLQFIPRRLLLAVFLDAFSPTASILRYPGMCERMRCLCNNLQMRSRSPPMALFRHPRPPS